MFWERLTHLTSVSCCEPLSCGCSPRCPLPKRKVAMMSQPAFRRTNPAFRKTNPTPSYLYGSACGLFLIALLIIVSLVIDIQTQRFCLNCWEHLNLNSEGRPNCGCLRLFKEHTHQRNRLTWIFFGLLTNFLMLISIAHLIFKLIYN